MQPRIHEPLRPYLTTSLLTLPVMVQISATLHGADLGHPPRPFLSLVGLSCTSLGLLHESGAWSNLP